jgi:hypothetical protein
MCAVMGASCFDALGADEKGAGRGRGRGPAEGNTAAPTGISPLAGTGPENRPILELVGSQGIRARKPRRKLPPAIVPSDNDLIPPQIMWPDAGSGFEANAWSPAGQSQRQWWFLRGLARGRRVPLRPALLLAALPLAVIAVVALGSMLASIIR